MPAKVKPVPDGFHAVTAHLIVDDTAKALEFYTRALGAQELFRMPGPDGRIMHAEMQIGDSRVLLADERPDDPAGGKSPQALKGSPVSLLIYTADAEALYKRALAAGATSKAPPMDMFWGDRWCNVVDPFGHDWQIATHVEDLTPEQIGERAAAAMGGS